MQVPRVKLPLLLLITFVIAGGAVVAWLHGNTDSETDRSELTSETFDRSTHSIDDPNSLWVVVNKQRPLPEDYVPDIAVPDIPLYGPREAENMHVDVRIVDDLERLVQAAKEDSYTIALGSGYRSASYQRGVYNAFVARDGQETADRFSARPGHSEHQTGLAVDFVLPSGECLMQRCFEDTPEGQWLLEHAHRYGFILRYMENATAITGYQYEPWHFRYVGRELAAELYEQGSPTLEEFFDLDPAPGY